MRQHVTNTGTYDREIAVYSTFFDLLRQTRKEKGLSKQDMSIDVAQFYYANLDKKTNGDTEVSDTCILLEDVVATGFRMKNKHAGCDDEHVHVILNSLAKYHALTIASLNKWKDEDGKVVYPTGAQFLKKPSMMEQLTDNFAWMKDNIAKRLRLNERTDVSSKYFSHTSTNSNSLYNPFVYWFSWGIGYKVCQINSRTFSRMILLKIPVHWRVSYMVISG